MLTRDGALLFLSYRGVSVGVSRHGIRLCFTKGVIKSGFEMCHFKVRL